MQPFSKQKLRREVLERLNGSIRTTDEDIYHAIDQTILQEGHSQYGTLLEKGNCGSSFFIPYEVTMFLKNICGMIQ